MNIYEKILTATNARVYGRAEEAQALLTAVIAKQNAVLISTAGTAKSMLIENILAPFRRAGVFSAQVHPATEVDDLFGALSLSALRENRRLREGEGYLQGATFAFIDEIFKASGATLSALLSALNERVFFEEGKRKPIKLQSVLGASNELPTEESGALADRFTLWIPIAPLNEKMVNATDLLWIDQDDLPRMPLITPDQLKETRAQALAILQAQKREIMSNVVDLSNGAGALGAQRLSDRGLKLACELVATSTSMRGSTEVRLIDYDILRYSARNCVDEFPIWTTLIDRFVNISVVTDPIYVASKSTTSVARLTKLCEEVKVLTDLPFASRLGIISKIEERIRAITDKKARDKENKAGEV